MVINSTSNQKFKYISKLKNKKYRDIEDKFIIESKKLVEEAISSADVDFIFLSESNKDYQTNKDKIVFDDKIFKKLSSLKSPDGFAAVVKKKKENDISSSRVLLLDGLNDPGNMGTIIRSAEAFGFNDVLLAPNTVDIYNEKTLRASMGSIFRLNIRQTSYDEIALLKKSYKLVAADMSGYDINTCKIDEDIILVIGNEANGLSDKIKSMTDIFVKIPMKGKIESLNAAIAASILMNNLSLWFGKNFSYSLPARGDDGSSQSYG